MRKETHIIAIALLGILQVAFLCSCTNTTDNRIQVLASTSLIESSVKDIGGSLVDVNVMIPPGSCPGHYDLRPGDVRQMSRSRVLFYHGFEHLPPTLLRRSRGHEAFAVRVKGNWLVPENYKNAALIICRELSRIDGTHRSEYEKSFADLSARIDTVSRALLQDLTSSKCRGTPVICSDQLTPLLKWMGLKVVASYGRPEEFTPNVLHHLIEIGKKANVRLVVDNLQSGPAAGKQIAEALGVKRAVLSNFPGGFKDTDTWEKCLRDNVRRVITALTDHANQTLSP